MGNERAKLMIAVESVHFLSGCADERRGKKGKNDVDSICR